MAIQKFEMFICHGIEGTYNAGKTVLSQYDLSATWDPKRPAEYILLGKTEVEIDVPEINVNAAQIEALEKVIESERAQSQSRVNILLDRLSKLKAIGHDSSVIDA